LDCEFEQDVNGCSCGKDWVGKKYIQNIVIRRTLGKLPFAKLRRWYDNIKVNLTEISCEDGII
jgi:hypothetical protein